MKFIVKYYVCGLTFTNECNSIAEAYKAVQAIVTSNGLVFPKYEKTLSEYMVMLADMKLGKMTSIDNPYFGIYVKEETP